MTMQRHASDGLQSGIPGHLPSDVPPDRGKFMPAAALTGDVVERGRKRAGLKSGPSPVQYPVLVEPQIPQTEVVNPGPTPEEAVVESTVTAVGENIQAVTVEETDYGEIVATAQAYHWFKLFKNVASFILAFGIGATIVAHVF